MTLREFCSKLIYNDNYKYIHINGMIESNRYASIKYMHHIINYITIDNNGYHFYLSNTTIDQFQTFTFKNLMDVLDKSIIIKFDKKFYYNDNLEIEKIILKDYKITIR